MYQDSKRTFLPLLDLSKRYEGSIEELLNSDNEKIFKNSCMVGTIL